MGKQLAGWPHPKNVSQQLNVQKEISDNWCPSAVCNGIGTIQYPY